MTIQIPEVIYLSRRNLLALLSKLDRHQAGDSTACSIVKYQIDTPVYQQTSAAVLVVAVEDDEYYGAQLRSPGAMVDQDGVRLAKPFIGVIGDTD